MRPTFPLLLSAALAAVLTPAAWPQPPELYLGGVVFERQTRYHPPPPSHGFTESLYGPMHLGVDAHQIAVTDVGKSPAPDLVVATGELLIWVDLDQGGSRRLPKPPRGLTALTAVDATGSPRDDLLIAIGDTLHVLDLDVLPRRWRRLEDVGFEVVSLAAVDVVGGPGLDLVASDGATIRARPRDGASWTPLAPPPAPPAMISAALIGVGGEFFSPASSERVLVASVQRRSFLWRDGSWRGPILRRFRTLAAAPYDVLPSTPPLGQMLLTEPLPATRRAARMAFADVTRAAGLDIELRPGGDSHCPGAVFTDLDGDRRPDIYLPRAPGPAHDGENLLYLGDGRGGFTPAAGGHGAEVRAASEGALALDVDNDGDRDLYVLSASGPNRLLRNDGGRFTDVTAATDPTPTDPAGDVQDGLGWGLTRVDCPGASPCRLQETLAAAAGDIDRDGRLDLYVGNHRCCVGPDGIRDVLYRQNADGTFTDITLEAGITREEASIRERSTQAVLIADLDGDLWPDIYVSNKGDGPGEDQLFRNRGDGDGDGRWDGSFEEILRARSGTAGGVTPAAMAVVPGDYDNDGDLDLFLTDIGNADLLRNRLTEDGRFALEVVRPHSLGSREWTWGASWADFDNDGDLDLHVASNFGEMDHLHQNDGGGRFTEVATAVGVGGARDTRASLASDFDGDGRLDLLVVHRGGEAPSLLHNTTASGNHWLRVELVGAPDRPGAFATPRQAVGARVEVRAGGRLLRRDLLLGGMSCGGTQDDVLHFGLGGVRRVGRLDVHWPSGRVTTFRGVAADRTLTVREADAPAIVSSALLERP